MLILMHSPVAKPLWQMIQRKHYEFTKTKWVYGQKKFKIQFYSQSLFVAQCFQHLFVPPVNIKKEEQFAFVIDFG